MIGANATTESQPTIPPEETGPSAVTLEHNFLVILACEATQDSELRRPQATFPNLSALRLMPRNSILRVKPLKGPTNNQYRRNRRLLALSKQ